MDPSGGKHSHELAALAHAMRQQGRLLDAKSAAQRAIQLDNDNPAAWFHLGAALAALGNAADAEAAYRRALALKPRYAEAWSNLGTLLGRQGRMEEEIAAYQQGIEANDSLAPIWSNLGNALCVAKRYSQAEAACRRAIETDARFAPAWVNLGRALKALGRAVEARGACEQAVALVPELPEAWAALGNVLVDTRQFDQAVAAHERAVALGPSDANLHVNLAAALYLIGADESAAASLRTALQLDPQNQLASWKLSTYLLEAGNFTEGWMRYESRWNVPDAPRQRYPSRYGSGGFPAGGKLLLWTEQGVGDEILYARMACEAAQRGLNVVFEVDRRLVDLFRRSFPAVTVVARTDPPSVDHLAFDHVLPAVSLCRWLRTSFDDFPCHDGYLLADAGRSAHYRDRLQSDPASSKVIGIAWRSISRHFGEQKTAPLTEWGPVLTVPGVTFVSLQYGDVGAECDEAERRFATRIVRLPEPDPFTDLDGLAALTACCDLVITTSNVSAHMTGALGQRGWLLLPKRVGGTWYWFSERARCPWYPSLKLFRQGSDGDWQGLLQAVANDLHTNLLRSG